MRNRHAAGARCAARDGTPGERRAHHPRGPRWRTLGVAARRKSKSTAAGPKGARSARRGERSEGVWCGCGRDREKFGERVVGVGRVCGSSSSCGCCQKTCMLCDVIGWSSTVCATTHTHGKRAERAPHSRSRRRSACAAVFRGEMADAGYIRPVLTTLAATAIPTSRPPARVALKPPLFPDERGDPPTRVATKSTIRMLASSVHGCACASRRSGPGQRRARASRAGARHWAPRRCAVARFVCPVVSAVLCRLAESAEVCRDAAGTAERQATHQLERLRLRARAKRAAGKDAPGQRLANLRDSLHKFLSRPMYAGLYLLEPRQRTPRGEDGDAMRLGGSGGGPSRSGGHRAGMSRAPGPQRSVHMVSKQQVGRTSCSFNWPTPTPTGT